MLTPDIISAFEGSLLEIEFLAAQLPVNQAKQTQNKHVHSCILAHFLYRTRPSMSFQQEGYQRGPVHVGKVEIDLRAYTWTQKQIDNYIELKSNQDFELMRSISDSVRSAMDSLGEELQSYLNEASHLKNKPTIRTSNMTFFDRFKKTLVSSSDFSKETKYKDPPKELLKKEASFAAGDVKNKMFWTFKNFKKAHNMIMW